MISKDIDAARVGISKSLMSSPCERKGAYGELVRDAEGRRIQFPMPEKVIFGRFIDAAHPYIVYHDARDLPWTIDDAVVEGLKHATSQEASEEIDWPIFELQGRNAIALFIEQEDGLAKMREHYEGLRVQGDNGRTLRADEDVIGTPDYLTPRGIIDVKSTKRSYDASKFYRSPEMPTYALLFAAENGIVPEFLAYQVYVRLAKPKWQWIEAAGTPEMVALGRANANRWRKGLALRDPDLFGHDTGFCGDCGFKAAIPEIGFEGCPIGQLVPVSEDAA